MKIRVCEIVFIIFDNFLIFFMLSVSDGGPLLEAVQQIRNTQGFSDPARVIKFVCSLMYSSWQYLFVF